MNNHPKISIVTPSYNQGQYLEQTILSILGQGYPNLEYIIIDGGSTDNSIEIIKKYSKYLTYWVSEKDKGMYHAIQKGFDKSTGEIMSWLNSDDMLSQNALHFIADTLLRHPKIQWIGGCAAQIDDLGRLINVHPQKKWNKYKYYLLDYKYIQQEGTFWRRQLWQNAGAYLNIDSQLAGDLELWLRFFQHADYFTLNIPIGLFRMRTHNQKSLHSLDKYHQEAEMYIKEHLLSYDESKQLRIYNFYINYISKIPFIRSLSFFKKPYENLDIFKFPPNLYYDIHELAFKLPN